jgi:hypothetical protein
MPIAIPPGYTTTGGGGGKTGGGKKSPGPGISVPKGYTVTGPSGGGGTTTSSGKPKPLAKRAARRPAAVPQVPGEVIEGHGGGIGGFIGEVQDITMGAGPGLWGLAKGAAKEITSDPRALVPGPEGFVRAVTRGGKNVGVAYKGFKGEASPKDFEQHPLVAGQEHELPQHLRGALHPTRFVGAYNKGHLAGKLLEDTANVAMVAGPIAKGSTSRRAATSSGRCSPNVKRPRRRRRSARPSPPR